MEHKLPTKGINAEELWRQLGEYRTEDVDWKNGRAPLYVFYAGEDVLDVAKTAYVWFMSENGLAPRAFPSLQRMESEVIEMVVGLLNGSGHTVGNMTSGGSESIFVAMKAARDWAADRRRPGERANIVAPQTAHPAFNKAAHYLGMEVKRVAIDEEFRADCGAMQDAMDSQTVVLVGSAPAFPHGVVDPIDELSEIARESGTWLHVDACVGGLSLPFIRRLGYSVPEFDFALDGVCSMSADLHKYGFTAKGASTVLFRSLDIQKYQAFSFDEWPKGKYETPNVCGTRPGGAIAAAWAVMHYLGEEGYLDTQQRIMQLRNRYIDGIERIADLRVFGNPDAGIISFGSESVDPHVAAEELAKQGWYPSLLREPKGIHLMLNLVHEAAVDEYLRDLAAAVERIRTSAEVRHQKVRDVTY